MKKWKLKIKKKRIINNRDQESINEWNEGG